MDFTQLEAALREIARPNADRRFNVYDVEIESLDENILRLRGRVLEELNRQELVAGLAERFPELNVDVRQVEVLRKSRPRLFSVSTNLTSMHESASFLSEMTTQMFNGVTVEVLWEQENWCFARQADGYLGWTYLPYLAELPGSAPTHLVVAPVGLLRAEPRPDAVITTRVLGGTAVCVKAVVQSEAPGGWVGAEMAGGWHGWLPVRDLRSLAALTLEAEARRMQMVADAFQMIGVPYLWGGCSAHGIDCSGFSQLLHRWVGLSIPRDADLQYEAGQPVEPPFSVGDLLFFGEKGEQRRITHVGISLGGWRIIHSSRRRNGVQVDDVQAVDSLREIYLCAARYIGA